MNTTVEGVYETIKFNQTVNFLGRNGMFKSKGIEVSDLDKIVYLTPLTSKNVTGRAEIQIPLENIPELIRVLQQIVGGPQTAPIPIKDIHGQIYIKEDVGRIGSRLFDEGIIERLLIAPEIDDIWEEVKEKLDGDEKNPSHIDCEALIENAIIDYLSQ